MRPWRHHAKIGLAVAASLWLGCEQGPLAPNTGTLVVAVYDGGDSQHPVSGVAITVTPVNRHATTGGSGTATFQLQPGGYYVDAAVCCSGPGDINFHEPVTLVAGRTTSVTLNACLDCVRSTVARTGGPPAVP
jgi:hypothetical protein